MAFYKGQQYDNYWMGPTSGSPNTNLYPSVAAMMRNINPNIEYTSDPNMPYTQSYQDRMNKLPWHNLLFPGIFTQDTTADDNYANPVTLNNQTGNNSGEMKIFTTPEGNYDRQTNALYYLYKNILDRPGAPKEYWEGPMQQFPDLYRMYQQQTRPFDGDGANDEQNITGEPNGPI